MPSMPVMNKQRLIDRLIHDEKIMLRPYLDIKGKLTIGVGRNLSDVGISQGEALTLLDNDIDAASDALDSHLPWWRQMDDIRQEVLLSMCFNMGINRLLGFK